MALALRVVIAMAAAVTCADAFLVHPLLQLAVHGGQKSCSALELHMNSEPRRHLLRAVLALGIIQGPLARVQVAKAVDDTVDDTEEEEVTKKATGARAAVSPAADVTDKVYMDIKIVGVNSAATAGNRDSNLDAKAG